MNTPAWARAHGRDARRPVRSHAIAIAPAPHVVRPGRVRRWKNRANRARAAARAGQRASQARDVSPMPQRTRTSDDAHCSLVHAHGWHDARTHRARRTDSARRHTSRARCTAWRCAVQWPHAHRTRQEARGSRRSGARAKRRGPTRIASPAPPAGAPAGCCRRSTNGEPGNRTRRSASQGGRGQCWSCPTPPSCIFPGPLPM